MSYINNNHFSKAVQFIYENIDKPITLEDIADTLAISLSSLKRLFQEAASQTPGSFIRKLRMELAFCSLKVNSDSVLNIALSSGYNDHSAFSRQFKSQFGFDPTSARQKPNLIMELEYLQLEEPQILELTNFEIQSVSMKSKVYFDCAPRTWAKLEKSLCMAEIQDDFLGLFIGVSHDNPHDGTSKDEICYSAGVIYDKSNLNIDKMIISGGYYARFRYNGKLPNIGLAYHYIFGKWIQNSKIRINTQLPVFQIFESIPSGLDEQHLLINVPILFS